MSFDKMVVQLTAQQPNPTPPAPHQLRQFFQPAPVNQIAQNAAIPPAQQGTQRRFTSRPPDLNPNIVKPYAAKAGTNIIPITELKVGRFLGQGSYGKVYYASWQGALVALKRFITNENMEKNFKRETEFMERCQSPHIVKLHGICLQNGYRIIMEYLPKGSLAAVLHNRSEELNWPTRWEISLDIGKGIEHLHNVVNVIHADLKSDNILLDNEYRAKISDFGLSRFPDERIGKNGTLLWRASELMQEDAFSTKASDVYAYGMTLWEIASRERPFQHIQDKNLLKQQIAQGVQEKIPATCPESYGQLIQDCWKDATNRPKIETAVNTLEQTKPKLI